MGKSFKATEALPTVLDSKYSDVSEFFKASVSLIRDKIGLKKWVKTGRARQGSWRAG